MNNFAEIVESSLSKFKAQTWQWDNFPAYGSLVTVESSGIKIYSIVYHIETGSIDPSRTPTAYQKTEQELIEEQPHIFEFLSTNFFCLNLGYQDLKDSNFNSDKSRSNKSRSDKSHNKILYQIAPFPAKIHSFVSQASEQDIKMFFSSSHFLQVLFNYKSLIGCIDELLLAIFKNLSNYDILTYYQVNNFIKTISLLSGNDYRHLKLFLQRVQPLINAKYIE